MSEEYDVIVIGGGTTGTAVVRDLVLRGFTNSLLIERDDFAAGTSGGCHSALHGGSRYAVSDRETAEECLAENAIYRAIVPQVVDPTDALWVAVTDEQVEFAQEWMRNADDFGLPYTVITPEEAYTAEPLLTHDIQFALRTIDTGFDPFRLCIAQAQDAVQRGAVVRTHHEAVGALQREDGRVVGLRIRNNLTGEIYEAHAKLVINATGPWCSEITELAGFSIPMKPNKGSTGIYSMRPTRTLIGILRQPADGDGLVSQGFQNTALLGTSSVDVDDPDTAEPGLDEITIMEDSVAQIIPGIRQARFIRMCSGVRPLYSTGTATGRDLPRGMYLLDHEKMEGVAGLITITGGKYATARLMGERTVDLACEKLVGKVLPCTSATTLTYGAESKEEAEAAAARIAQTYGLSAYAAHKFTARYGTLAEDVLARNPQDALVIDEAVQSLGAEVPYSFEEENVADFLDVRRRTRIGMGQDQGTYSIYKARGITQRTLGRTVGQADALAVGYLQERWKGVRVAMEYGSQLPLGGVLRQAYVGVGGYDLFNASEE